MQSLLNRTFVEMMKSLHLDQDGFRLTHITETLDFPWVKQKIDVNKVEMERNREKSFIIHQMIHNDLDIFKLLISLRSWLFKTCESFSFHFEFQANMKSPKSRETFFCDFSKIYVSLFLFFLTQRFEALNFLQNYPRTEFKDDVVDFGQFRNNRFYLNIINCPKEISRDLWIFHFLYLI